jgi:hypothetical protein
MDEYQVDIQGREGWALSVGIVDELVRSWRAEVLDYDVTPTGGVIRLTLPNDLEFRIARSRVVAQRASQVLALSLRKLRDSRRRADETRAYLARLQPLLAA